MSADETTTYDFTKLPDRDELNMRVLQRLFKENKIQKIEIVVPKVSLYRSSDGDSDWKMLQIHGPLFLLRFENKPCAFIFVMNNTCYKNTENFTTEIPETTVMKVDGDAIYFKFGNGHMLSIRAKDKNMIRELYEKLQTFGSSKETKVAACVRNDPVFRLMMTQFGK